MASYTPPTLTGYNSSPPPDDGSQSGDNEVAWDKHIDKIGDPLKNFSEAIDSAVTTAFTTVDADIVTLDGRVDTIDSQLLTDSNKYDEDTGAADAYVVTLSPAISSYVEGHMFRVKIGAGNSNTGACNVTVNGVTPAQSIKTQEGEDPAANDLLAGGIYTLVYDGTNYQIQQRANQIRNVWSNLGSGEPAVSTTLLTLSEADIGTSSWEGVGPTASGEPNIWTALDALPSDIDWIDVFMELQVTSAAGGVTGKFYARADGSSATFDNTTMIISTDSTHTGATTARSFTSNTMRIPVASKVFDISTTGPYVTMDIFFRLIGYGWN